MSNVHHPQIAINQVLASWDLPECLSERSLLFPRLEQETQVSTALGSKSDRHWSEPEYQQSLTAKLDLSCSI